jgi:hypothetical protein
MDIVPATDYDSVASFAIHPMHRRIFMSGRRSPAGTLLPLFLLLLAAVPAGAQVCNDPGAYCEGWSRDSTRREVSLTRTTLCGLAQCPAVCSTSPITALPSIRIGNLNHVVLGFSVPDACVPECTVPVGEPCYNLGVSYRRTLSSGSESVAGVYDCDPFGDPGTTVSAGASFSGTYSTGGTQTVTVTNIDYGLLPPPDDCGSAPIALDLTATGPGLAVQSHFTFNWLGNSVTGYTETRTYTALPGPNNTVHITVSSINYGAGTYTVSVPDASTEARGGTWGQLKLRYR